MDNRLREIRKNRKLTQKDIASYLGIAVSTYSYWESGTYDIDLDNLNKLADYYGVSSDFLLGRETVPQQSNLDDFQIALCGATSDLSKEDKDKIMSYVNFVKNKEK